LREIQKIWDWGVGVGDMCMEGFLPLCVCVSLPVPGSSLLRPQ